MAGSMTDLYIGKVSLTLDQRVRNDAYRKLGRFLMAHPVKQHHALTLSTCFRQSRSNSDTRELIAVVTHCFATSLCFECGIFLHNITNMCQIINNYLGKSLSGPPVPTPLLMHQFCTSWQITMIVLGRAVFDSWAVSQHKHSCRESVSSTPLFLVEIARRWRYSVIIFGRFIAPSTMTLLTSFSGGWGDE